MGNSNMSYYDLEHKSNLDDSNFSRSGINPNPNNPNPNNFYPTQSGVNMYQNNMSAGNYPQNIPPNYISQSNVIPYQQGVIPPPQVNTQNLGMSQNPGLYDPKFMGTNWETAQTQHSEVKIPRSCWLGYHRNNFHPSMTQYRISYDEFNQMIDKIEKEATFGCIQTLYILIVLLSTFAIILFIIGLFIEPGESVTSQTTFDTLDSASTGLIITGLVLLFAGVGLLSFLVVNRLRSYEFNIRRMLQFENQHSFYSRSIQWLTTPYCQHIIIKCMPVSAQQYYLMLQQTNQLKITEKILKEIEKDPPK